MGGLSSDSLLEVKGEVKQEENEESGTKNYSLRDHSVRLHGLGVGNQLQGWLTIFCHFSEG